ncbi:MAG: HAMP domain-containing sensor histidine kinase [Eubacteriales bacterium]|nr:HAMP domain-containing sensor histidine kinase [Eubacteriales bacterium]
MRKKNTLQFQVTGIVGIILIIACLLLTGNSLFSADNYYGDYAALIEQGLVEYDSVLPENSILSQIEPDISYQDVYQKFSVRSVAAMLLTILLALAATYWAVGRLVRPLRELTQSLKSTDDQNLDKRVNLPGAQAEVKILADAYNGMLERLEEAFLIQKSFAANAAHELKTPLAVIKSSLQVLDMNPDPGTEDYQEFMEDTDKSLERIIKTVEGLLALANLTAVQEKQNVEVYPLLELAVEELSPQAETRQIELSVDKETECFVYGNQDLLYRAFYNLIENAVKYNLPGGRVMIRQKQEGDWVSIQVEDNGIGMEKETVDHIFEPFYRGDPSRSQKIPGSGLGLAVVKMILDKHDGKIETVSEIGKGSIFRIYLKAAEIRS